MNIVFYFQIAIDVNALCTVRKHVTWVCIHQTLIKKQTEVIDIIAQESVEHIKHTLLCELTIKPKNSYCQIKRPQCISRTTVTNSRQCIDHAFNSFIMEEVMP
ncbi:uncharacterized protein J3R85_017143 [Psidium guajava]|nr:uncharacterized protein J3R85_017143 [Psidium guajava]